MTVKLYQAKKKPTQALNGFHAATSAEVGLKLSHLGGSVVIHPSPTICQRTRVAGSQVSPSRHGYR